MLKDLVLDWINNGCDFHKGIELYQQYGLNPLLKKSFFVANKKYPVIEKKLYIELCNLANVSKTDLKKKNLPKTTHRLNK
jgi:hypothetical protein